MRVTNHHGRGTAKHVSRQGYTAPHIDPKRTPDNRYWTWDGGSVKSTGEGIEAAEIRYYGETFGAAIEARNGRYRKRGQHDRVRTVEEIYEKKPPEESLLYIGDKSNRSDVPPDVLWNCVCEYVSWEMEMSKKHGEFYMPLSLAMHVDERGQCHVHERGVYRYKDSAGQWDIGQSAALEASGIRLPDKTRPRDKDNNRKMMWDEVRRKKWIAVVEAAGYQVEHEPEAPRPHLPLEAWEALQDAKQEALQEAREAVKQEYEEIYQETLQEAQEASQAILEKARTDADRIRDEADKDAENYRRFREIGKKISEKARKSGKKQQEPTVTRTTESERQAFVSKNPIYRDLARERGAEADAFLGTAAQISREEDFEKK